MENRTEDKKNREQICSASLPGEIIADRESVWQSIRLELSGKASGCGLNMADAAVTRHAHGLARDRTALRWLSGEGRSREWTFAELERRSNRMANVFRRLGLAPGQVVATFCGRVPELYLAALGALKTGAVYCGLYSSYGPEPILHRLAVGKVAILLTTRRLYATIRELRPRLPCLTHILMIDEPEEREEGLQSLQELMDSAPATFEIPPTAPETPALLHFTSGTTGMPKGVIHVHEAALHHILTGRTVLALVTCLHG